jgi:hypothetical protein
MRTARLWSAGLGGALEALQVESKDRMLERSGV